jgi:lipopolysaccharide/colanic/teichoic acid biosynthesis glycosyltransferase
VLGLLVGAYVAAVVLHTKLDRFSFIHPLETALLSVGVTLLPAGGVVIGVLDTPLDTLGLIMTGGGIGWYVLAQLLQASGDSQRSGRPVGSAIPLLADSPTGGEPDTRRPGSPRQTGLNEIAPDSHASVATDRTGRAHDSVARAPAGPSGRTSPFRATRTPLGSSSEASIERRTDRFYQYAKRAMDVLAVVLSLPITLPLIAVTALAVRLGSRGPVLFWQERVGQGGETFQMVKFRSMYVGHEGEDHAVFTDEDDDRVTTVGRFIRASRLDELPQIWNVLRGDMSLIGPRPEQVGLADDFGDALRLYDVRHRVQPGITGWAQVLQGYAADVDETRRKLEYDLYYIKHQSIVLDLLIVYLTLKTLLTGFGAR